jgi:hypothetical protein
VYDIRAEPADIPVTTPVTELAEMIEVLPLDHVPPVVALESVTELPLAKISTPLIDDTPLNTLKVVVREQPVESVYIILVVPRSCVVATPDDAIVATDVLELDHVPPAVALAKVIVLPRHMLFAANVMDAGSGFAVITLVTKHPVGIT